MTELSLYKFITDNEIEWRWDINKNEEDVLIFIYPWNIEDFNKLFSPFMFDDGGIECVMMDGYFCFWMEDICQHYDIILENVFPK